jgi:hypothetical protein
VSYEPIFDEFTAPMDDSSMFLPCDDCGGIDCMCDDEDDLIPYCQDCGHALDPNGFCDHCDEDEL